MMPSLLGRHGTKVFFLMSDRLARLVLNIRHRLSNCFFILVLTITALGVLIDSCRRGVRGMFLPVVSSPNFYERVVFALQDRPIGRRSQRSARGISGTLLRDMCESQGINLFEKRVVQLPDESMKTFVNVVNMVERGVGTYLVVCSAVASSMFLWWTLLKARFPDWRSASNDALLITFSNCT